MAVYEQYGYNRDEEELDVMMGGVGMSQPRRMVEGRIATRYSQDADKDTCIEKID